METYDGPAWILISTLCGESATRSFREVASRGPLSVLLSMATHAHHVQHFLRDTPEYKMISHLVFETIFSSLR